MSIRTKAAIVVLLTCTAAPGMAQHGSQQSGPPTGDITMAAWTARMDAELSKAIDHEGYRIRDQARAGTVRVKFNCSESGAPAKVAILKSSGQRDVDRAAVAAMKRIATLHPLPPGLTHEQKYEAVLLFDINASGFDRRLARLRDDAAKANGWYDRRPTVKMSEAAAPVTGAGTSH
ncbi:energy transducer TonB family protein [Sphingomonas prati]|uniref:TonB family protein n=1 Tax=Sphingomonas prati TaxID=1843237 RepID=A0A7W9F2B3_9SPHN|nr:energy transducer TonB [Sphingomonas prati]MBB5730337.1 TonB family protein [Sphingomonas prati]GGE93342.1 hypothetical protein GCM10011404_27890 [Sphingomonas prati]